MKSHGFSSLGGPDVRQNIDPSFAESRDGFRFKFFIINNIFNNNQTPGFVSSRLVSTRSPSRRSGIFDNSIRSPASITHRKFLWATVKPAELTFLYSKAIKWCLSAGTRACGLCLWFLVSASTRSGWEVNDDDPGSLRVSSPEDGF